MPPSPPPTPGVRGRLLLALHDRGVRPSQMQAMRLEHVVVDAAATYLEARSRLDMGGSHPPLVVDDGLRNALEDYLNASAAVGRPFVDYRPDIGVYLFPSHTTGEGIRARALRTMLRGLASSSRKSTHDPPGDNPNLPEP